LNSGVAEGFLYSEANRTQLSLIVIISNLIITLGRYSENVNKLTNFYSGKSVAADNVGHGWHSNKSIAYRKIGLGLHECVSSSFHEGKYVKVFGHKTRVIMRTN
jgi:hypothetical protein